MDSFRRAKLVTSSAAAQAPPISGDAAGEPDSPGAAAITVDRLVFPVTLSDGNTYEIVGYLYYKGSYEHRPLQVLVHGITYTHACWDLPTIHGVDYSYARHMARHNYAVLALDSLGAGESSKPDGDLVNLAATADSVHQVLVAVRRAFARIALVGHSFGAVINSAVQSTHGGAEALVNTGFAFTPHEMPIAPEAIAALLGAPYVSLPPEFRAALFYWAETADPAVIAHDNAEIADTFTRGQLLDMIAVFSDPNAAGIDQVGCPVLVQLGEHDPLHPASLLAADAALYVASPQVATAAVLGSGHMLSAHPSAATGWQQIVDWLAVAL